MISSSTVRRLVPLKIHGEMTILPLVSVIEILNVLINQEIANGFQKLYMTCIKTNYKKNIVLER